ncbi:hypothetical protein ACWEDZ_34120, partial [Streptomyces sp. NPDC005047]
MSATMAIRIRASERPGLLGALAFFPFLGATTFAYSLSGRFAPGRRHPRPSHGVRIRASHASHGVRGIKDLTTITGQKPA